MSELLLELDVGLVIIAVDGCVVNAGFSVLVIDNDLAVFILTVLRLLYKEEVPVTPNIAHSGRGQGDALDEGARNWRGTTSMS